MKEMPPYLREQAEGVFLQVKVAPRSSRNEWAGIAGDRVKVRITAPPVDSAANRELIAFLADQFAVARNSVSLVRGQTSRNKTVFVTGLSSRQITALIDSEDGGRSNR